MKKPKFPSSPDPAAAAAISATLASPSHAIALLLVLKRMPKPEGAQQAAEEEHSACGAIEELMERIREEAEREQLREERRALAEDSGATGDGSETERRRRERTHRDEEDV